MGHWTCPDVMQSWVSSRIPEWVLAGVSDQKYGAAEISYFKNGNKQLCSIFRHDMYNFYLVVCDVSTP